jgi:DNA ligase D-like protein (predicted ligase)
MLNSQQRRRIAACPHGIAAFVDPMQLKVVAELPCGDKWLYEVKWDGFRCISVKQGRSVQLWSRNKNALSDRFPSIVAAVKSLPFTSGVLDGELVALAPDGRPSFQMLQNSDRNDESVFFYAFDVLHYAGRDLTRMPLVDRKDILNSILNDADARIRFSASLHGSPEDLIALARQNKLEGVVAKQMDSVYEPGVRSGKWAKFKCYQEGEFLIGGFVPEGNEIDALLVGALEDREFHYAAKVQVYWRPDERTAVAKALRSLRTPASPFSHIPRKRAGDTSSAGITDDERNTCIWLQPCLKAEVEFIEKTDSGLLRHCKFKRFC